MRNAFANCSIFLAFMATVCSTFPILLIKQIAIHMEKKTVK